MALCLFAVLSSNASETMKGAKKDYDNFKTSISAKMESLEKEIEELKVKTKTKGTEVKDSTLEELEAARDDLKTQINKLEEGSKENWKSMKQKISESADSLHSKLQKALKD
jgi:cell division protein FtsB